MTTLTNTKKSSLFSHLKEINSERQLVELKKLIQENNLKNFELDLTQLKAILSLFSEHHLFIAFKLLVEHFASITPNIKELKSTELKSTELVSILSLFHTLNRGIAFETLLMLFTHTESKELKNFELKASQLKAILFLFYPTDRFNTLKLLVKNFDVKIQLTASDIKELETCLSRDPAFNNLLPFAKKKFWDGFFVKDEKVSDTYSMQQKIASVSFNKLKNPRCNTSPNFQKKVNLPLRLETLKCQQLRGRFKFFENYVKVHGNQTIVFKDIEELSNFIKIFPQHDAIEFLDLPYIKNQIKAFGQQKARLSEEAYNDLLNHLTNNSIKKLLSPFSPNRDKQGIFKEKQPNRLPDIVSSHNIFKIR
jgi:hypothetical protein